MTKQDRIRVGEMWLTIAQVFNKEIQPSALKMMLDSIDDLAFEKVEKALSSWVGKTKQMRHPFPAEIRAMCEECLDPDTKGKLISSRVIEAISRFGYCNADDARKYIGETGWIVVKRFGGWQYVCENVGVTMQLSTFTAQARDIAIALDLSNKLDDTEDNLLKLENRKDATGLEKQDFAALLNNRDNLE
jgi:hypothetical protein